MPKTTYNQLCGIIGGMGPAASVYLQNLIIKMKSATRDQNHIPYLLYNNPQIPDRTAHLLQHGETPLPMLVETAKELKKAGATFLAFPCNTAHAYIESLEEETKIPVLNMITLSAMQIAKQFGKRTTVGLLATTGTIATNIFQEEFADVCRHIAFISPNEKDQEMVMKAIYDIKAGKQTQKTAHILKTVAKKLIQQGAQVIIEGCTEIPLAMPPSSCDFQVVDPMELLAKEIIKKTLEKKLPVHIPSSYSIFQNV